MTRIRRRTALLGLFALLAAWGVPAQAAEKLRLLIIDGQNNHNWKAMTPPMKETSRRPDGSPWTWRPPPTRRPPKADWESFRPDFSKYDVVLSNYNGEPWPDGSRRPWRSTSPAAAGS